MRLPGPPEIVTWQTEQDQLQPHACGAGVGEPSAESRPVVASLSEQGTGVRAWELAACYRLTMEAACWRFHVMMLTVE